MKFCFTILLSIFLSSCSVNKNKSLNHSDSYKVDTLTYFDQSRNRKIPVAIYQPKFCNNIPVIFSHGWGENKGGDYFRYKYLTEFLASKGYFVVSIQHELPTDEMLAMQGKFIETRMPNWERGAQNILFVLNKIKVDFPKNNYQKLALIGHSNGGDMTVLFAHKYPNLAEKIISMDNRRMPLPKNSKPKIYTFRSNDAPADDGVIPTDEEKKLFKITVDFTNINHGNMDEDATPAERKFITEKILQYLKD